MIPGGENFLSLDDDSVAWLLAQEERHKFRFRRCVVLWGTLAVNRTLNMCNNSEWQQAPAVCSSAVIWLSYSQLLSLDCSFQVSRKVITLLYTINSRYVVVRLFIMFPSVVNMEF